jgi:hypothetical protein
MFSLRPSVMLPRLHISCFHACSGTAGQLSLPCVISPSVDTEPGVV